MAAMTIIRMPDVRHDPLRRLADSQRLSLNKLINGWVGMALAQFDAQTRFHNRATRGNTGRGLALLDELDLALASGGAAHEGRIVAPEERLKQVRQQLARPSLQQLELHKNCGFFSIESLTENADHMKKWAKDSDAIEEMAEYVDDAEVEETDAMETKPP